MTPRETTRCLALRTHCIITSSIASSVGMCTLLFFISSCIVLNARLRALWGDVVDVWGRMLAIPVRQCWRVGGWRSWRAFGFATAAAAISPSCPLVSWSPGTNLPLVLGAVAALGSVLGGLSNSVQDIGVLVREVHAEHLVELVHHLAGIGVTPEGVDVVASGLLDAGQLGVVPGAEHEEAHASGQLGFGDQGGVI